MNLLSKRRMTKLLHTKSIFDIVLNSGDEIEGFTYDSKSKHGRWSSSQTVLSLNSKSWTVVVPTNCGTTMRDAIGEARLAVNHNKFASTVLAANVELDKDLSALLSSSKEYFETGTIHSKNNELFSPQMFGQEFDSDYS